METKRRPPLQTALFYGTVKKAILAAVPAAAGKNYKKEALL